MSPLFNRSHAQSGSIPTEANLRALFSFSKHTDPRFFVRASFRSTLKAEGIEQNLPNLCLTKQNFTYTTNMCGFSLAIFGHKAKFCLFVKGGTDVYTVKELDSHAKHRQSFRKQFGRITVFLCQNLTSVFVQVL